MKLIKLASRGKYTGVGAGLGALAGTARGYLKHKNDKDGRGKKILMNALGGAAAGGAAGLAASEGKAWKNRREARVKKYQAREKERKTNNDYVIGKLENINRQIDDMNRRAEKMLQDSSSQRTETDRMLDQAADDILKRRK